MQAPLGPPAAVPPAEQRVERAEPIEPAAPAGPRVGLVFDDGTHVVLDPADPRAVRFAAIADELNR